MAINKENGSERKGNVIQFPVKTKTQKPLCEDPDYDFPIPACRTCHNKKCPVAGFEQYDK